MKKVKKRKGHKMATSSDTNTDNFGAISGNSNLRNSSRSRQGTRLPNTNSGANDQMMYPGGSKYFDERTGTYTNGYAPGPKGSSSTATRPPLDPNSEEAQYLKARRQQLRQEGYSATKIDNPTAALASAWGQFRADNAKLKTEGYDYHTIKDKYFNKPVLPTDEFITKVSGPKGSIVDAKPEGKELQDIRVRAKAPASHIYNASQQYNVDQRVDELAKSLVAKGVDVVALEKEYSNVNTAGLVTSQSGTDDILAASADAGRRVIDGQRRSDRSVGDDSQAAEANQQPYPPFDFNSEAKSRPKLPTTSIEQRRDEYIRNAMKGTVYTYVETGGPNAGKTITVMFPSGSVTGGGDLDPAYEKVGLNVRQLSFDQNQIDPEGALERMGMSYDGSIFKDPQQIKDDYAKNKGVWNNLTGDYDKIAPDGSIIPSSPPPRNADGSYALGSAGYTEDANIKMMLPRNAPGLVDTSWLKPNGLTMEEAMVRYSRLVDADGNPKVGVTDEQLSNAWRDIKLSNVAFDGSGFATAGLRVEEGMIIQGGGLARVGDMVTAANALATPEWLKSVGYTEGIIGADPMDIVLGADGKVYSIKNTYSDTYKQAQKILQSATPEASAAASALVNNNAPIQELDKAKLNALKARFQALQSWGGPGYDGLGSANAAFPDITTDAQFKQALNEADVAYRGEEARLHDAWGRLTNEARALDPATMASATSTTANPTAAIMLTDSSGATRDIAGLSEADRIATQTHIGGGGTFKQLDDVAAIYDSKDPIKIDNWERFAGIGKYAPGGGAIDPNSSATAAVPPPIVGYTNTP